MGPVGLPRSTDCEAVRPRLAFMWGVVDRLTGPQSCHVLIPRTCDCGRRDSADVVKDLEVGG